MKGLSYSALFILMICPLLLGAQTYLDFKIGLLTTPILNENQYHKYFSGELNYNNSFSLTAGLQHKHTKRFRTGVNLSYDFYSADVSEEWYNPMGGSGQKDFSITLGYLVFSFFPQWNFGRKASFFINAGPYFGFLTNSFASGYINYKPTISDALVTEEFSGKAKDDVAEMFINIKVSTGIEYKISESVAATFSVSGRYGTCLVNSQIYSSQFDVTYYLGVLFKIGDKRWEIK